jgi:death-on-curing protein
VGRHAQPPQPEVTPRIEFLTVEEVLAIHEDQIRRYGGAAGLRDRGLLESALVAAEFSAYYEGPDLFRLAATYLVHLIRNHPFVDGNKRTAVVAARVFLRLNGVHLGAGEEHKRALERLAVRVAQRQAGEEQVADLFRRWAREGSSGNSETRLGTDSVPGARPNSHGG